MTEKQQKILSTALELFATEGYSATSTARIAKVAGVSEGLIFKHFKNKDGLLQAVLEQGNQQIAKITASVVQTEQPKMLIKQVINLPLSVPKAAYPFWRLIYTLKWQQSQFAKPAVESLKVSLANAFGQLGYSNPTAEAEIIMIYVDGLASVLLNQPQIDARQITQTLEKKYNL